MKKTKKSNTPRHKRLNRKSRLQAAKTWITKYNGKNLVRGYSKHFAVDLLCAAKELELLGYEVKKEYIEKLKIDLEYRVKKKQERKNRMLENQEADYIFDGLLEKDYYHDNEQGETDYDFVCIFDDGESTR
ncbi:hypothetical protein [Desulfuribacillus alkaliarsenatis]|uniref:Uncharacterized protein n=1 Tax=Desulfuribacillus alkaliarsenatis TaxID=766136 RepID=A0A1E5G2L6_9FIRM|nr:hypothetical protein [Desulfuribacillus alkaliarsenatis]OEF97212.1 hypothetical protein BHF68_14830 [Desulfuribacillus alkaliarsenatis]